jgi:hypothetical protein
VIQSAQRAVRADRENHGNQEDSMGDLTTRRGFVKGSAVATAGATALGSLLADSALARSGAGAHAGAGGGGSTPIVAWVRDPARGEISVMVGEREVRVRDRGLAARIARAAG